MFVLIKLVPLVLLALFAWLAAEQLGASVNDRSSAMADEMLDAIRTVGQTMAGDAQRALDDRAREAIESLTTGIAQDIAAFLSDRDQDILQAARQPPTEEAYRHFLANREREIFSPGPWALDSDGEKWKPEIDPTRAVMPGTGSDAPLGDNAREFHFRPPEDLGQREMRPLYAEMTLIGLDGRERIKVRTGNLTTADLADVGDRMQTFVHAETYWPELQALKSGEIYVSEVIGSYVGSRIVGPYLPATAEKSGIPFEPEKSAYAGVENPVGKRFRGILRWATPVERNGKRIGYVTLALDHDHLRQFTDRITPTPARFTPIADASSGNYAFMWDHKHRAISHPRDYFIFGYNAETGRPETPWMDQTLYEAWQASGLPSDEFLAGMPAFQEQSLTKKPAPALLRAGTIALDCRYLNFAPQCDGFSQLTENGGSGSFVIYWAGLWKLTTAAAIPYYTGQYGQNRRGFGYVTIGANVEDFHRAATESGARIQQLVAAKGEAFERQRTALTASIAKQLALTGNELLFSTLGMLLAVIIVAIWMATYLTRRITRMIDGIGNFKNGNLNFRLQNKSSDEMGALARSFNEMADAVQDAFAQKNQEILARQRTAELLSIAAIAFEAQEGMVITDANQVVLQVNQAFCDMTGYAREEILGQKMSMFNSGRHDTEFYAAMWASIQTTGSWQGEIWDRRKTGEVYPKWLCITAVKRDDESVSHYVGTNTDITQIKGAEEEIRHLAFYDSLTSLPNRRLLLDRLQKALLTCVRNCSGGALLFIDLDKFKMLNDTLGHHKGDLLLQQVARRLEGCVRKTDTVARLGGDEFVVMLEGLPADPEAAALNTEAVGRQIRETLNLPYDLKGCDFTSTPSIGMTLFHDQTSGIDALLQEADLAMYEAKTAGRNALRFYDHGMQAAVIDRAALEADLRKAISAGQLHLHYQALLDRTGRLTGAEALLRWRHPERGMISPAEFIPLAEETGLIVPIGAWVLETVCAQLADWAGRPETARLSLAANVSACQFRLPDFVEQVLGCIDRTGANAHRLKLELTESMLVSNIDDVIAKMHLLQDHGVHFALDDFGTGFSSLSYLKRLPLEQVKIDRSFVQDLGTASNDAIIVNTIISLAHNLGFSVVAEGVETETQRVYLMEQGCDTFQGYLFGRPVPIQDLLEALLPAGQVE